MATLYFRVFETAAEVALGDPAGRHHNHCRDA